MIKEVKGNELYFAKVKPNAIIPTKDSENAGWDVYACFEEDYFVIKPHETIMIPTGIASAFSEDYVAVLKERGSTGTKGIAQRCGVIDSGFRGEWKAPVTNVNDKPIIIAKDPSYFKNYELYNNAIIYPYSKAICQALLLPVPKMEVEEIGFDELKEIPSERGFGMLGSSKK